uniref:Uncharacterized protein n=1 Tax=Clytia hemisphaerica TaxID=252671 RepID=A0A7M5WIW9_9CNID
MMLKALHKYQLQLLALQSLADNAVKSLLINALQVWLGNQENGENPNKDSINKVLSKFLRSEKNSLKRGYFLASFAKLQSLIYEDVTLQKIKEEIDISKLDVLLVIEILENTALGQLEVVANLSKALKVISNYRVLVANENSEAFWEQFEENEDGVLLSFDAGGPKTWSTIWKENTKSVMDVVKHLHQSNMLNAVDYHHHLEEIRLFGKWSKQEILQNWYHQIEKQIKSLSFLHKIEKQVQKYKEVEIVLRITNIGLKIRKNDESFLSSFVAYLKSFFYESNTRVEPDTIGRIEDIELDSEFADMVNIKMGCLISALFGDQGLVENSLVEVSKGVKVTEAKDEEDRLLPITLTFELVQKHNFCKSSSTESYELWKTLSEEITQCIKDTMSIDVDLFRTSWLKEANGNKVTVFIIKYSLKPWLQSECENLIQNLQDWTQFTTPVIGVMNNDQIMANLATMVYRISTYNHHFFDVLENFSVAFNEKSFTTVALADEIKHIDFIDHFGLQDTFKSLQDQADCIRIKNFKHEPKTKEPNSNIEVLSTPRGASNSRKTSPRSPTPSAPKMSNQNRTLPDKQATANDEDSTLDNTDSSPRNKSPNPSSTYVPLTPSRTLPPRTPTPNRTSPRTPETPSGTISPRSPSPNPSLSRGKQTHEDLPQRSATPNGASPREDHIKSSKKMPGSSSPNGVSPRNKDIVSSGKPQVNGNDRPGLSREQSLSINETRSNEPSPRKDHLFSPRSDRSTISSSSTQKKKPTIPIIQQNGVEIHDSDDDGEFDDVDGSCSHL